MRTLALVAKKDTPQAQQLARQIQEYYPDRDVIAEPHLAEVLGWPAPESDRDLVAQADLVIVLGGDGTLIHAARMLSGKKTPILGVNLGSLGFMTEVPVSDLFSTLSDVIDGKARIDARMKLSCKLIRGDRAVVEDEVLNDVVLNKGALARLATHEMSIDGGYVTTYHSDGVVVATPTGSTAYALSAGGPIVHPSLNGVIVAPICSHALNQRPIVVPSDRVISLTLNTEVADVYLTLDGQAGHALRQHDRVEVQQSPNRAYLVRNPRFGYFSILRQKLHWGER